MFASVNIYTNMEKAVLQHAFINEKKKEKKKKLEENFMRKLAN